MELALQFGYGMMAHTRRLIADWGGGTVILSPRDLRHDQLVKLAGDTHKLVGGKVLLDPQFYLPHADHARLTAHDYWPDSYQTGDFWSGEELATLLTNLLSLNAQLRTDSVILPGMFGPRVDDDWLARHTLVVEEARSLAPDNTFFLTVALGAEAVRTLDDVHAVLDELPQWDVEGVYLVCEHPNGEYLVTDPIWMANLLDLTAGIRLRGRKVVVGYSSHQMLILASAGVDAIASGTWMNVRSFPPEKFRARFDDEIRKRTTWYYCPQALSEFTVPYLDIAARHGILDAMKPPKGFPQNHAELLFQGPQPTTVGFTEQAAFRHYLATLRHQVNSAHGSSFKGTVQKHEELLDAAERLLSRLHKLRVTGRGRDFAESVQVGRAALRLLESTRGVRLEHRWPL